MEEADRFSCVVTPTGIKVAAKDKPRFDEHCRSLEGQPCELTIEAEPVSASAAQRRWWFGKLVPPVAEEAGYDRDERHACHLDLLRECFGVREAADGKQIPKRTSWTQLSMREAWQLMEWAPRFAARMYGLDIRLPEEVKRLTMEALAKEGVPV